MSLDKIARDATLTDRMNEAGKSEKAGEIATFEHHKEEVFRQSYQKIQDKYVILSQI